MNDSPLLHQALRALAVFLLTAMVLAFLAACSVVAFKGTPPPRLMVIIAAPPLCLLRCESVVEAVNDEGNGAVTAGALSANRAEQTTTTQTSVERTNNPPPAAAQGDGQ